MRPKYKQNNLKLIFKNKLIMSNSLVEILFVYFCFSLVSWFYYKYIWYKPFCYGLSDNECFQYIKENIN